MKANTDKIKPDTQGISSAKITLLNEDIGMTKTFANGCGSVQANGTPLATWMQEDCKTETTSRIFGPLPFMPVHLNPIPDRASSSETSLESSRLPEIRPMSCPVLPTPEHQLVHLAEPTFTQPKYTSFSTVTVTETSKDNAIEKTSVLAMDTIKDTQGEGVSVGTPFRHEASTNHNDQNSQAASF